MAMVIANTHRLCLTVDVGTFKLSRVHYLDQQKCDWKEHNRFLSWQLKQVISEKRVLQTTQIYAVGDTLALFSEINMFHRSAEQLLGLYTYW